MASGGGLTDLALRCLVFWFGFSSDVCIVFFSKTLVSFHHFGICHLLSKEDDEKMSYRIPNWLV